MFGGLQERAPPVRKDTPSLYQEQPPNMMLYRPAPWLPASPAWPLDASIPHSLQPCLSPLAHRHRLRESENLHSAFKGHTTHSRESRQQHIGSCMNPAAGWVALSQASPTLSTTVSCCPVWPLGPAGATSLAVCSAPSQSTTLCPLEYHVISPVLPACHV